MAELDRNELSKLSAWVPKRLHKQAKVFATETDIDLQDLVAKALSFYLTEAQKRGAAA